MQPIMLTIFLAIMSLTSWSLFQQVNQRTQVEAAETVAHTMRELAQTQRIWHTQHGEGVPWHSRYLTHVPDICPPASCYAAAFLQLSVPLWYCEITIGIRAGDRLPIFSHTADPPACPREINGRGITGRITDRHGNPRGSSTTVAQASLAGVAVPWWNDGHPDAENYATWETRTGPTATEPEISLAGDHSFQVIYRAGPDAAATAPRDWQDARARAQRIANALGALACIGRKEGGSSVITTWYDCDEGAEIGRRRGPGSADLEPYYVIARYERPLARTMVDSMLPRDGKRHAWGDFRFSTPKTPSPVSHLTGRIEPVDEEIRLMHDSGSLAMRYGSRLIVGCGGNPSRCQDERHVDLDARAVPGRGDSRGAPPLPGLYMRTLRDSNNNDVPITLVASPNGPEATFGRIRMSVNGADPGVVEGVRGLSLPSIHLGLPAVRLSMVGTGEKRVVVCSNEHVSGCTEYHP